MLPQRLIDRFHELLAAAEAAGEPEPTAMSLATVDDLGQPCVRVVLLKALDARGFSFYTNTESDKGRQLASQPRAAICFLWKHLDQVVQVRAQGAVEAVDDAEADAYFASRPYGSQIGAWASDQSRPLADRATLERRIAEAQARFAGAPVPRPPHWGGYRLVPDRLEFWHGREYRLHDRFVFEREESNNWRESRLFP
ncbi:MAG: pyridoxamine 5'-phosphate oxidase [Xanthomonadales bacterium]|nr:pyridoxamine 5'-phosphate oxidase [Xanthomonadales bacterium]